MTPEDVARQTKQIVITVGAAFGKTDRFRARGESLGLSHWPFYFGARAGVLGEVDAEVVTAACGFFSPDLVRDAWDTARAMVPLTSLVAADVAECTHWARTTYGDLPELDQLADLAEHAVEAAESTARPLFAAWRSLAVADDDPASRVALALLRLREHRGASHLIAIHEHGLTPLRAVLAGPGADKARANGWSGPWPSVPATDAVALAGAEQRTDELAAAPYAALTSVEREHYVRLLGQVHDAYGRGQCPEQA
ncbi:SCO6745 family protein [Nonomuraea sp. SBT364]|uniref:SCO6745 family protein n=1 Tax=Nonomuraea sp. SBT364 TaxID=1580530 RepID=UPI00066B984C|nr:hypothetical protein [Nonomuraea sp. SBT364]